MLAALSFLTIFGRGRRPGPRTLEWFPAVGVLIGLGLGGLWWLVGRAWDTPVAAALVLAADLAVTGALHLDGLVDSADGLIAPMERTRRLAAMAAPEAGALGVAVAAAVLLLRWAALDTTRPAVLLLGGLWCLSRTIMALVVRTQPYAREAEGGLASAFAGNVRWAPLGAGAAVSVALLCAWGPLAGAVAGAGAVLGATGVVVLARRRIGGYTGDVLGAAGVVAETAGLVVAAARW